MARHELTDHQWERLAPLLPPQKPLTGRPNNDHRTIINALLLLIRTGAPWRDLPERYGCWKTVASRFYRWQQAGIWRYLRERGVRAVIPRQKRERRGRFDKAAYRKRKVNERLINRLKQFRRVATRYAKRAVNYRAMLTIAAITLWL